MATANSDHYVEYCNRIIKEDPESIEARHKAKPLVSIPVTHILKDDPCIEDDIPGGNLSAHTLNPEVIMNNNTFFPPIKTEDYDENSYSIVLPPSLSPSTNVADAVIKSENPPETLHSLIFKHLLQQWDGNILERAPRSARTKATLRAENLAAAAAKRSAAAKKGAATRKRRANRW